MGPTAGEIAEDRSPASPWIAKSFVYVELTSGSRYQLCSKAKEILGLWENTKATSSFRLSGKCFLCPTSIALFLLYNVHSVHVRPEKTQSSLGASWSSSLSILSPFPRSSPQRPKMSGREGVVIRATIVLRSVAPSIGRVLVLMSANDLHHRAAVVVLKCMQAGMCMQMSLLVEELLAGRKYSRGACRPQGRSQGVRVQRANRQASAKC